MSNVRHTVYVGDFGSVYFVRVVLLGVQMNLFEWVRDFAEGLIATPQTPVQAPFLPREECEAIPASEVEDE